MVNTSGLNITPCNIVLSVLTITNVILQPDRRTFISGTGFTDAISVLFNGTSVSFTVLDDNQIQVIFSFSKFLPYMYYYY